MLTSSGVSLRVAPAPRVPRIARIEEPEWRMPSGRFVPAGSSRCALIWARPRAYLLRRALLRGLAVEDPRRVPVGDVDREAVHGAAVAVVGGEVALGPELGLGERGQRPRRVDERDVAAGDVDRLAQVELDAGHPVGLELAHPLEAGSRRSTSATAAVARSAGIAETNQSASIRRRRRGGRGPRAPSIAPAAHLERRRRVWPMWKRTPRRLSSSPRDRSRPRWSARRGRGRARRRCRAA